MLALFRTMLSGFALGFGFWIQNWIQDSAPDQQQDSGFRIGFNWIHHQIRIRSESQRYQQIYEIRLDFVILIEIIEHRPRLKK